MNKPDAQISLDPVPEILTGGPRHQVPACPTGLADPPDLDELGDLGNLGPDTTKIHGSLGVEKLEGRQESGRDAQDEAEEDEPEAV